jgi:hypothetical protein
MIGLIRNTISKHKANQKVQYIDRYRSAGRAIVQLPEQQAAA